MPIEYSALALYRAYERKLAECLPDHSVFDFDNGLVMVEVQGMRAGEITVTLLAQEKRDFCALDVLEDDKLQQFARFLLPILEEVNATRLRIGPLGDATSIKLMHYMQTSNSNFAIHDAVLSIEPLLDKRHKEKASKESLRRALAKVRKAGLHPSSLCLSPEEMHRLHAHRWGSNRSLVFFEILHALTQAPCCECISFQDSSGRIVGQQIDFCFVDQRFFYCVIYDKDHPGLGTALLAESIHRFYGDSAMQTYSFGRGGESYKYRYAQYVRCNHYLLGFRTDRKERWPWSKV